VHDHHISTHRNHVWLFVNYAKPHAIKLGILFFLILMLLGLQLSSPILVSHFIDSALAARPMRELVFIAFGFLGLTIGAQFVSVLENYVAQNVAWTATNALRADLTRHCLRLGPSFFNKHTAGVMVERIDGDVSQLANFLSRFAVSILSSVLTMVGIIAAVACIDWHIGLVLLLFAVLGLLSFNPARKMIVPRARAFRQAQSEWTGLIEESVTGREDIRTCSATAYAASRLSDCHNKLLTAARRSSIANTLGWSIGAGLFGFAHAIVILGGAWVFFHHRASIGTIYLLFTYIIRFLDPLFGVARQIQDVQQSIGSGERILELFAWKPDILDTPRSSMPSGTLDVEFAGVSFAYTPGKTILDDISFRLPAGKRMAIIGPTASGKSTIAKLLTRFFDVATGSVRIGGVDVRDLAIDDLRSHIAYVTQDVQLFRGTLRDNISLFDMSVDDEILLAAINELGLSGWYGSLPQGLDTLLLGDKSLSAGEAQLVTLVRVYLRTPVLVILDEASARLDPATAATTEAAIGKLVEGRTVITIAHNVDAVRSADVILALESGRVKEIGSPRELLVQPGSYYGSIVERLQGQTGQ
jgi:ABC-type multidrug transport system fused ATPase/permease subunit